MSHLLSGSGWRKSQLSVQRWESEKAQKLNVPLPVLEGGQKPDPRTTGHMGTKGPRHQRKDWAWQRGIKSDPSGRSTVEEKPSDSVEEEGFGELWKFLECALG